MTPFDKAVRERMAIEAATRAMGARRLLEALLRERAEEMRRRSWPGQKYTPVDDFVTAPRRARHG